MVKLTQRKLEKKYLMLKKEKKRSASFLGKTLSEETKKKNYQMLN